MTNMLQRGKAAHAALQQAMDDVQAELEKLRAGRDARDALLDEIAEFALDRHDVEDGPDGPRPNEWMQITNMIDAVRGAK